MKTIKAFFKLVFLTIVVVVGIAIYSAVKRTDRSSPAPDPAPTITPAPDAPAVTPDTPAVIPAGPSLDQQLATAADAAKAAKLKVTAAKTAAIARLARTPDYIAAKKAVADADAALEQAKRDDTGVVAASQAKLDARSALRLMENKAIDTDAGVGSAVKALTAANQIVFGVQKQIDDQNAKVAAAQDKEAHDTATKVVQEYQGKKVLQLLIDRGFITSYDTDGTPRADPLLWMECTRDQKSQIVAYIRDAYVKLGINPYFDVKSDRNDTVFASCSSWSGITIKF